MIPTSKDMLANRSNYTVLVWLQYTPSAYLAEMRLTTEERLATITEMYPPTITELLDIGANSNQKVEMYHASMPMTCTCSRKINIVQMSFMMIHSCVPSYRVFIDPFVHLGF